MLSFIGKMSFIQRVIYRRLHSSQIFILSSLLSSTSRAEEEKDRQEPNSGHLLLTGQRQRGQFCGHVTYWEGSDWSDSCCAGRGTAGERATAAGVGGEAGEDEE